MIDLVLVEPTAKGVSWIHAPANEFGDDRIVLQIYRRTSVGRNRVGAITTHTHILQAYTRAPVNAHHTNVQRADDRSTVELLMSAKSVVC